MLIPFIVISLVIFGIGFTRMIRRGTTIPVQKNLRQQAAHFKGSMPFVMLTPSMRGFYKQHRFVLRYLFSSELNMGDPDGLDVRLFPQNDSPLRVYVYTKDPGTVLNAKRVITGDADLDREFRIFSNAPDEARRFLLDENRKKSIIHLKERGWQVNYIKGDIIRATTMKIMPDLSPQHIEGVLDELLSLQIRK